MNQEQVKDILLKLDNEVDDFKLIFSGKTSKKVHGLYLPEKKEIIIHNKNFNEDNSLLYTAIHEYAHHVHFENSVIPVSSRSHTIDFWNIFHKLLFKAEELGLYNNIFDSNEDFKKLTIKLKESYLFKNAELMKEAGKLLIEAVNLCTRHKVRFEDYIDRGLNINRTTADTMIKIYSMDINPKLGFDNMKIVSRIKDKMERKKVENEFLDGKTQDMVKSEISKNKKPDNTILHLEAEKRRLQKTIETLNKKLTEISKKIIELKQSN